MLVNGRAVYIAALAASMLLIQNGVADETPMAKEARVAKQRILGRETEVPPAILCDPLEISKDDDELTRLLKAHYNERLALTLALYKRYAAGAPTARGQQGVVGGESLFDSARRLLAHGMLVFNTPAEKAKLLNKMQALCVKAEVIAQYFETFPNVDTECMILERHRTEEFRLELEIAALKLKKAEPNAQK